MPSPSRPVVEAARTATAYRDTAEAAWRWVLHQVRWDDGPWIPAAATEPPAGEPAWDRDGMHSGIAGLAHVLAEIRVARPWTAAEHGLADAVADRLTRALRTQTDISFFDGLVSALGALTALGTPTATGAEAAVARLAVLAEPDGWPQTLYGEPRFLPGARIHDLTLGTAGVLLGAVWAGRHGVAGGLEVAGHAADVLVAEAEAEPTGTNWSMVPRRFRDASDPGPWPRMPNLSHGLAGIAASLAVAGVELGRPDLTDAARSGAEHLVSLGDDSGDGFVVPRYVPAVDGVDDVTHTWCHGGAGTSLLFLALDRAGVREVAGRPPLDWHRRCLHSVRTSGLPERTHPGFWDNDGRCCGTAGVGEVFLDSWQRSGHDDDLAFALHLADTLLDRAIREGLHVCWRFVEHRSADPLLPPGVGWMQGAAGIASYLFRVARVVEHGRDAEPVPRMDTWWALPTTRPARPPEASTG